MMDSEKAKKNNTPMINQIARGFVPKNGNKWILKKLKITSIQCAALVHPNSIQICCTRHTPLEEAIPQVKGAIT
jgi:hypothetical protein